MTPFHRQQPSPFHDERRFAGSEKPALKVARADLSLAIHLQVVVLFGWTDISSVVLLA
jgi:hypothetical protein